MNTIRRRATSVASTCTALAFAAALAAAAAGCGREERTVRVDGGDVTIHEDGDEVEVRGETGGGAIEGRFGEDVSLPEGFPDDVPIYPGATVVGSMQAAESGRMVTLRTADAPDRVQDFYRERLAGGGWEIASEMNFGGQRMLTAEKDDRVAAVQVGTAEDGTRVVLTVSEGGE